jgi:glycosyltransferase involved in cell wall biosynthesis
MPVYNAGLYLKEALDSILNQTYSNFEIHIFNDGSTDNSREIIISYEDPRIIFHDSCENKGYVYHLNRGISLARGEYIARCDADDYCTPDRFQLQVEFLNHNLDHGLCGSWMKTIGNDRIYKFAETHEEIVNAMINENPMAHPVVMIRKDVLKSNNIYYEQEYMPAEDYKMWATLMYHTKLYNIPKVLLHYRQHPEQISQRKAEQQKLNMVKIQVYQFQRLCSGLSDKDLQILESILLWKFNGSREFVNEAKRIFEEILISNNEKKQLDSTVLKKKISGIWYLICKRSTRPIGSSILRIYKSIPKDFYSYSKHLKLSFFFVKERS